jgi:integrase
VCRWNGEKLVYPTAFNVVPKNWNTQKGEIRNVIDELNKVQINSYLNELKTAAKNIYDMLVIKRVQANEIRQNIKKELDKWTGKTFDEKPNFWRFVNNYIEQSNKRIDVKTGRIISYRTIQEYNTTVKVLKEFEAENRQTIDFDNISLNTLTDFRDFLTTGKEFSVNNIAKHIDNLKQFLRAANSEKIMFDSDVIDSKRFKTARETAYNIYLNESELTAIENTELNDNQRLDKARDLFLIGCYTGLRVSDYNNIKPHNIKGEFIELYQNKTGGQVVIPIHKTVRAILNKYNGNTPPKISDQRLNEYIKEVCKKAGIIEQTEKQQTKGGTKVKTVLEKWQMVTSHTARRSFATNMIKAGLPMQTIMKITGHQKEATFLKYVKLSNSEHAEIMQKYWNKTTLKTN